MSVTAMEALSFPGRVEAIFDMSVTETENVSDADCIM